MKIHLIFICCLLIFSLVGCKSAKPLISSQEAKQITENTQQDIVHNSTTDATQQLAKETTNAITEDATVVVITVEYDTDKPLNPTTGKPPVKKETRTEISKNRQENTKIDENITKIEKNDTHFADKSTIVSKIKTKIDTVEESPKDPYRFRWIVGIVTVIVVAIIYFTRKYI